MNKKQRRFSFAREVWWFVLALAAIAFGFAWGKVYLDARGYLLKADSILGNPRAKTKMSDVVRAGDLYMLALRSYAPLNPNNEVAIHRILDVGRDLESAGKSVEAQSLYMGARAVLNTASFLYTAHPALDLQVEEALGRLQVRPDAAPAATPPAAPASSSSPAQTPESTP